MLSVSEALKSILDETVPSLPVQIAVADSWGRILRETITSDGDIPPFDKALMDGYAVRCTDVTGGQRVFQVVEEILAGGVPSRGIGAGEAARIMTGAPLPSGADGVVIVERTEMVSSLEGDTQVRITCASAIPEQNIIRQGAVARMGAVVVPSGKRVRAQEMGAMVEAGSTWVKAAPHPSVAILATGDELIPVGAPLGPGQIRNSNELMLASQMTETGGVARPLGIAPDQPEPLLKLIRQGLESDFLLLSGGVSAGKRDLVPAQLAAAGVRQVFHKIQMKPGKPLWFGIYEKVKADGSVHRCLVFGLPGNPVSSMVCADLFVRPALRKFQGIEPTVPPAITVQLSHRYKMQWDRPTYHPARLFCEGAILRVEIVDWIGSSDLRSTVSANGTVFLPPGEKPYEIDDKLEFHPWEGTGLS